jgi:hypothetical protein
MRTQALGWNIEPDYLVFFQGHTYEIFVPSSVDGVPNPDDLSRLCVPATLALFGVLLALEGGLAIKGPETAWRDRAWFYLAAGALFYLSACAMKHRGMGSMLRHTFPVYVLLVLAALHLLSRIGPLGLRSRVVAALILGLVAIALMVLQVILAGHYTHSEWVA